MAVIENMQRSSVSLKLNAGVSSVTGNMLTKSCSLGKVAGGADAEKIMTVADLLSPLLAYPAIRVERTEVTFLERA